MKKRKKRTKAQKERAKNLRLLREGKLDMFLMQAIVS